MSAVHEILLVPEVARLLRISKATTYRMAERGELPGCRKVSGQWRISRTALLAGLGLSEVAA